MFWALCIGSRYNPPVASMLLGLEAVNRKLYDTTVRIERGEVVAGALCAKVDMRGRSEREAWDTSRLSSWPSVAATFVKLCA